MGWFFFERCSLVTATACANKFSDNQFVCTHPRSYTTTSFEKEQSIA